VSITSPCSGSSPRSCAAFEPVLEVPPAAVVVVLAGREKRRVRVAARQHLSLT
jgi:hypothetical protein